MTTIEVGFFRELDHGDPRGPSIYDSLSDPLPLATRRLVASYLRAASVVMATSARARDVLHPERGEVSGISVMTDGRYLWTEDLAYYVDVYGCRVPDGMVRRAEYGPPAAVSPEELNAIARELLPGR